MTMISLVANGRCEALVDALQAEFGAILAARIVEAEALDFLWDARVKERYLGQHIDVDVAIEDGAAEFSRVAILSLLAGRWQAGLWLVDGEGRAVELLWKQAFDHQNEALEAFENAV
jgi:hypothetical protein